MLKEAVKRLREERGWTQVQLAKQAKVSQQLIWKIESGMVAETRKLPAIAAAFGLTVEELLGDGRPTPTPPQPPSPEPDSSWPFDFDRELLEGLSPGQLVALSGMIKGWIIDLQAGAKSTKPESLARVGKKKAAS